MASLAMSRASSMPILLSETISPAWVGILIKNKIKKDKKYFIGTVLVNFKEALVSLKNDILVSC
jgi:hypothetical protein